MPTLGERIRELREALDLSLRELARAVDVSAAFMSDVELGRRDPSDALLAKIAKRLKTTLAELKKYDRRAPLEDIKRIASTDPAVGIAMRRIVERIKQEDLTPEELLDLVNARRPAKNK